jgi:aryl carrier-like protein
VSRVKLCDAWDGSHLKFTFRGIVDSATMEQWYEIVQIGGSIQFSEEEDAIV